MSKPEPIPKDLSAEEKIKEAARKLFTTKGYAATKTRDIANEAGINLALVNYYFRSKEKLFDIIRLESLGKIGTDIKSIIDNKDNSFIEKIEILVAYYIDTLLLNPDLPLFVLTEIRNNPDKMVDKIGLRNHVLRSVLIKQLQEILIKNKLESIHPVHFLMNILSLTVFPFAAGPMMKLVSNIDDDAYKALIEERKKLVPEWVMMMLQPNDKNKK